MTLPNLAYVIDTGYIHQRTWDTATSSYRNMSIYHSQDGCKQRRGRVGRVRPGEVFRLYRQDVFLSEFPEHTAPALKREPRDMTYLQDVAAGADLHNWRLFGDDEQDPLCRAEHLRAMNTLQQRGMITETGELRPLAADTSGIETPSVNLAHLLASCDAFGCLLEMATFVAFVTSNSGSPFLDGASGAYAHAHFSDSCYDDFEFYMRLMHFWMTKSPKDTKSVAEWAKANGLNHRVMKEMQRGIESLVKPFMQRAHTLVTSRELDAKRLHRTRLVIAYSFPEWIYARNNAVGSQPIFAPNSTVCPSPYCVEIDRNSACYTDLDLGAFICLDRNRVEIGKARELKVFARYLVRIDPEWLKQLNRLSKLQFGRLLQRTFASDDALREQTTRRVTEVRELKPADISIFKTKEVRRFTFIKRLGWEQDDNPQVMLRCEDMSGVVVASLKHIRYPTIGLQFRAEIVGINEDERTLELGNRALMEMYQRGTVVSRAQVVRSWDNGEDTTVDRFEVELEPGVVGRLRVEHMGAYANTAETLQTGDILSVLVYANVDGKLELALTSETWLFPRGQRFVGRAIKRVGHFGPLNVWLAQADQGYDYPILVQGTETRFAKEDGVIAGGVQQVNEETRTITIASPNATELYKVGQEVREWVACKVVNRNGTNRIGFNLLLADGTVAFLHRRAMGPLADEILSEGSLNSDYVVEVWKVGDSSEKSGEGAALPFKAEVQLRLKCRKVQAGEQFAGIVRRVIPGDYGPKGIFVEFGPNLEGYLKGTTVGYNPDIYMVGSSIHVTVLRPADPAGSRKAELGIAYLPSTDGAYDRYSLRERDCLYGAIELQRPQVPVKKQPPLDDFAPVGKRTTINERKQPDGCGRVTPMPETVDNEQMDWRKVAQLAKSRATALLNAIFQ